MPRFIEQQKMSNSKTMSFYQSKALSITTRGIGLSTCNLCFMSANITNINPPIYAMYRVFLGLVEAKLATIKQWCYFVKELCHVYDYQVEPYMLEVPLDVALVPESIKRIIDAVDVINYNDVQYIPVVAAQVYDDEGRLVPRPENILLSNLRAVVVALSSKDTPARYRTSFKEYCPIPGAIWDNNDFLINANEIIPEDYDLEKGLLNDMWPLSAYVIRMRKEFPDIAKGGISEISPKLSAGTAVSKAALVSRNLSVSKLYACPRNAQEALEEYVKRCNPQVGSASSGEFFFGIDKVTLSTAECLDGQASLLGEYPDEKVLGQIPVLDLYSLRHKNKDESNIVIGEYISAMMISNEALFVLNANTTHGSATSKSMSRLERGRKLQQQQYNY